MNDVIRAAGSILQMSAEELEQALERARVVGVLDAWAAVPALDSDRSWATRCVEEGLLFACHLVTHDSNRKWFGKTPDAARAAAAKAIESGEV